MSLYRYEERRAGSGAPLLLLLHGTGGDPRQLLGLGAELAPEAHLVAPAGDVLEHGVPRFFKRRAEGVYDMDDLARATDKMQRFVKRLVDDDKPASVMALGYSNGANILASLLFAAPGAVDRAVLMHPLIPFEAKPQPALKDKPVLITAGRNDPVSPAPLTERLESWFRVQGAAVETAWHEGGHELRREELEAVRRFLSR
ncbi:MAG TPA: alpha/beta hydrolase [Devosia sp.]|nr:alpha/beta hydrolase [Devosia sp.]